MRKYLFIILLALMASFHLLARTEIHLASADSLMLIRISEIEVYPQYLDEYLEYARTVGATSVKEEAGVICIFPMQVKRDGNLIRIVEIYASDEAYKHHIATSHFQKYKKSTLHMVKSLDLVDMNALDQASMSHIFQKMKTEK